MQKFLPENKAMTGKGAQVGKRKKGGKVKETHIGLDVLVLQVEPVREAKTQNHRNISLQYR